MSAPLRRVIRESHVQRGVVETLQAHGFAVFRLNAGLARSLDGERMIHLAPEGTPDLLAVPPAGAADARPWWVEVKTPTGALRGEQLAMRETLLGRGQRVMVLRSIEETLEMLQALGLSRVVGGA